MQQITIRVQHQGNHSILSIWRHRCNMWVKERHWRQNDPMWARSEPFFTNQSIYPLFSNSSLKNTILWFLLGKATQNIICKRLGQIYYGAYILNSRRTLISGYFKRTEFLYEVSCRSQSKYATVHKIRLWPFLRPWRPLTFWFWCHQSII